MTLEQLILSIRPSWDAACCLLIVPPLPPSPHPIPQNRTSPPPLSGRQPPSPLLLSVCAQGHALYGTCNTNICNKRLSKKNKKTTATNNKSNRKTSRCAALLAIVHLSARCGAVPRARERSQCRVLNASVFRLIPFDSSLERSGQRESTTCFSQAPQSGLRDVSEKLQAEGKHEESVSSS